MRARADKVGLSVDQVIQNKQAREYDEFVQWFPPQAPPRTTRCRRRHAMQAERAPESERPPLGGRDVDEHGVNSGLLRCPRCLSRLVSCRGRLQERQGPDASFWVPHKPSSAADAPANAVASADTPAAEVAWEWTEQQHTWWWSVADMEEVDNDVETMSDGRPASQAADWPRLAEAPGSSRHALALRGASGEPAGRSLSSLVFDTGR